MDPQIRKIVNELKEIISNKYDLRKMMLFGSTSRGERIPESDIDVFVCLSKVNREIEEDLFDTAYELELKYDCVIDLFVFDEKIHDGVYAQIPLYRNILREGINV